MTQNEEKDLVVEIKSEEQDKDKRQSNLVKFLLIMIVLSVVITLWQEHSWRLKYEVQSKYEDENGVNHYVLYDDENELSFDYVRGEYKNYLFMNDDGEGFWSYTERVKESNFVGKCLYTKKDELLKIFSNFKYQYELIFDDENELYEKAVIYIESYSDIRDESISLIRESVEALVPDEFLFTDSNEMQYGRFEFVDSEGDVIRTINLRTR